MTRVFQELPPPVSFADWIKSVEHGAIYRVLRYREDGLGEIIALQERESGTVYVLHIEVQPNA